MKKFATLFVLMIASLIAGYMVTQTAGQEQVIAWIGFLLVCMGLLVGVMIAFDKQRSHWFPLASVFIAIVTGCLLLAVYFDAQWLV